MKIKVSTNILLPCDIHQYLIGAKNVVTTGREGCFFDALIQCINANAVTYLHTNTTLAPTPAIYFLSFYLNIYLSLSHFFKSLCTYPSDGAPTLSDANRSSKNSIHTRVGITPPSCLLHTYMPHGMMEVV